MASNRMPRGAVPSPRHKLAAATPSTVVGTTPPNHLVVPKEISFWGNDKYGDCVTAEEAFAKACHKPEIFISEAEAIKWATQHNFLNGAMLSDVLETMVKNGFKQGGHTYDDGAALTVDWTNPVLLTNAISNGPVKIGIAADQLDVVYNAHQRKNGWFATGFKPDSNEDHCVSLCGHGSMSWLAQQLHVPVPAGVDGTKPGYGLFTWNSVGIIDIPSLLAITHEAWLRKPTTIVK
jgi:hypothetical protein